MDTQWDGCLVYAFRRTLLRRQPISIDSSVCIGKSIQIAMFSNNTDYRVNAKEKVNGCHISVVTGFILTFLVMILILGVGVVVHYASPSKTVECQCDISGNRDALEQNNNMEFCEKLALEGNADICKYLSFSCGYLGLV